MTASQIEEAERLAREIESTSSSGAIISAHLAEERGQEVLDVRHSPTPLSALLLRVSRACVYAQRRDVSPPWFWVLHALL